MYVTGGRCLSWVGRRLLVTVMSACLLKAAACVLRCHVLFCIQDDRACCACLALRCRGWLSAAAVRGSVLWAPSKTLGLRRAWAVGKKGELEPAGARGKAHRDRVTALAAAGGFLYSVSYDGTVKMWDAASLELVMEERGAHAGGRLHCAAAAADGHLYTGGDDKARPAARALCLQRWHRPPPLCLRRQHRPPPS